MGLVKKLTWEFVELDFGARQKVNATPARGRGTKRTLQYRQRSGRHMHGHGENVTDPDNRKLDPTRKARELDPKRKDSVARLREEEEGAGA